MPARLRPSDPLLVAAAAERFRAGTAEEDDVRLLVKHLLALLVDRAPGGAVEIRVPPYAAAQAIGGTTHKRGTPPAVVEVDAEAWVQLGLGELHWVDAERAGRLRASGERSDLSPLLPLLSL